MLVEFEFYIVAQHRVLLAQRGMFYKDKIFLCFMVKFLHFALYLIPLYKCNLNVNYKKCKVKCFLRFA